MKTILIKLKTKLNKNGKAFLAVGNSKYACVMVDTKSILQEVALANGYKKLPAAPFVRCGQVPSRAEGTNFRKHSLP